VCAKSRKGRFKLKRITDSERSQAKLRALKGELMRRRHQPIPEQGGWLARVLRGHANYYGVPDNSKALHAFRYYATEHGYRALRRRSQHDRLTWKRMRYSASDGYQYRRSSIPGQTPVSTLVPKGGAQCASSARWDLRGGRVEPINGEDPSLPRSCSGSGRPALVCWSTSADGALALGRDRLGPVPIAAEKR
jgi:hypothetical protein